MSHKQRGTRDAGRVLPNKRRTHHWEGVLPSRNPGNYALGEAGLMLASAVLPGAALFAAYHPPALWSKASVRGVAETARALSDLRSDWGLIRLLRLIKIDIDHSAICLLHQTRRPGPSPTLSKKSASEEWGRGLRRVAPSTATSLGCKSMI